MQEFLRQYGKVITAFLMAAIGIVVLFGSTIGMKGLLNIATDSSDNYAFIAKNVDENGEIKTDASGNPVDLQNDVNFIKDSNGNSIAVVGDSNINDSINSSLTKFSDFNLSISLTQFVINKQYKINISQNTDRLFTGTVKMNGREYNLLDSNSSSTVKSYIKINSIKYGTSNNNVFYIKNDRTVNDSNEFFSIYINANNHADDKIMFLKSGCYILDVVLNVTDDDSSNNTSSSYTGTYCLYVNK